MLTLFKHVKGRLRVADKVVVDGVVAHLHRVTSLLLLGACILVCSRQYIGEPIHCVQDKTGDDATINEKVMNTFCFVMTTYTITPDYMGQEADMRRELALSQAHPGVQPNPPFGRGAAAARRHAYYQWVPIVLLLQAALFNIPHVLWARWEGGLVRRLLTGAAALEIKVFKGDKEAVVLIAKYFVRVLHSHHFLVFGWIFCDVLAFINVIVNLALTDRLLGGHFLQYGFKVLHFLSLDTPLSLQDPFHQIFPKVTKCTFHKFGPTGTLQQHDALCVMALNVINEKIYLFFWFWFLLLGVFSLLGIVMKIASLIVLWWASNRWLGAGWGQLVACGVPLHTTHLQPLLDHLNPSDWIFFQLLARNMRGGAYMNFVLAVGRLLKEKDRLLPQYKPQYGSSRHNANDPQYKGK